MKGSFAALALLLVGSASGAVAASGPDAVLAQARGEVYYRTEGSPRYVRAKGGEQLLYGDSIRTGAGAVAQIAFADDRGAVLVRGDSSFTLAGNPDDTWLNFRFGEFLIGLRKALAPAQRFRVRTPSAVAAVRGTLFWGKSGADRSTTYAGLGHSIAVTAKGKTVIVGAGQTTTVPFDREPSLVKPHDIPAAYWANFAVDGGLLGLEALSEATKP